MNWWATGCATLTTVAGLASAWSLPHCAGFLTRRGPDHRRGEDQTASFQGFWQCQWPLTERVTALAPVIRNDIASKRCAIKWCDLCCGSIARACHPGSISLGDEACSKPEVGSCPTRTTRLIAHSRLRDNAGKWSWRTTTGSQPSGSFSLQLPMNGLRCQPKPKLCS